MLPLAPAFCSLPDFKRFLLLLFNVPKHTLTVPYPLSRERTVAFPSGAD